VAAVAHQPLKGFINQLDWRPGPHRYLKKCENVHDDPTLRTFEILTIPAGRRKCRFEESNDVNCYRERGCEGTYNSFKFQMMLTDQQDK
jgi:hypothetical protein